VAFSFDQIFAADPANPANVAQNASVTIFAPGDATMTPLTITDPDGTPLPNPIPVNANGFGSAFAHATLDRVAWAGGGFTGFFTSYEGMKQVAVDAQAAAEAAAATAGADAAAVATAAIGDATADAAAAQAAAEAAAVSAANAAATASAPADTAIAAAVNNNASATKAALNSTYLNLVQAAKNPDLLIAGAVTLDGSDQVTSAVVQWPDSSPGTLTITSRDTNGAVLAYNITYGSPVTKTFTQPTITRNANGAATNVPQIVVS
jgi:hypothetical protein